MLKVRNYFVSLLLLLFLSTSFAAGLERKDAVKDQTITTGTATFTLANLAPAGARSISTHTSGSTVRYRAINSDGSEWEDGEGVVTNTAGTWTLTRVNVFASSNSNALTSFSAGTKSVLTIPTAKDFDVPDWATGSSVASATTINLDAATGGIVHVTGTTTIGTVTLSRGPRLVIFDGALTLTHNATTNNLPGGANITTATGDRALYIGDGTTAYCVSYVRAAAAAVTTSNTQTLTNKTIDGGTTTFDGSVNNVVMSLPGTALVLNAPSAQPYLAWFTAGAGVDQKWGRITRDSTGIFSFEKVNDAFNVGTTLATLDANGALNATGSMSAYNNVYVNGVAPALTFAETDQGTNLKRWWNVLDGGTVQWQTRDDADAFLTTPMALSRVGNLVVTGDTNGSIASVGTSGYGSFTAQGSGTNPAYLFFANASGERSRISSTNGSDITFSTGSGTAPQFQISHTASAVNQFGMTGAVTGSAPVFSAQGSDTNIPMWYSAKGTGAHVFLGGGVSQFAVASTPSAVNYLQTSAATTGGGPVLQAIGSDANPFLGLSSKGSGSIFFYTNASVNAQFEVTHTASSVNRIQATGAAAGAGPTFTAAGTDTDISINYTAKGAGHHIFNVGPVRPGADNTQSSGTASFRWSTVYAGTGTINTSDAREKTPVRKLSKDEIAAAIDISHEIGGFRWLSEVAKDGDLAKTQVGMTVQRAIEIMRKHGLDPTTYGFIVHDTLDNGGDRYGFRPDQLALFIEAGLTARLDRLEAANDARYAKRRAK